MITDTDWALVEVARDVTDNDIYVLSYQHRIKIITKAGKHLVYAKHDGADEGGDIETLKTLCLFRFNQGEQS